MNVNTKLIVFHYNWVNTQQYIDAPIKGVSSRKNCFLGLTIKEQTLNTRYKRILSEITGNS